MGAFESASLEVRLAKIGVGQVAPLEVRAAQRRADKPRATQIASFEVGSG